MAADTANPAKYSRAGANWCLVSLNTPAYSPRSNRGSIEVSIATDAARDIVGQSSRSGFEAYTWRPPWLQVEEAEVGRGTTARAARPFWGSQHEVVVVFSRASGLIHTVGQAIARERLDLGNEGKGQASDSAIRKVPGRRPRSISLRARLNG